MNFEKIFLKNKKNNQIFTSDEDLLSRIDNPNRFLTKLLDDKSKQKLIKAIKSGLINDFQKDSHEISKIIGRENYAQCHWATIDHNRDSRAEEGVARKKELELFNVDKRQFILDKGSFNVINIHSRDEDSLSEVCKLLPSELPGSLVDISYSEKNSSNNEELNYEDEIIKMSDSSGEINKAFLKEKLAKERAVFLLMGGNLRGCFLSALDSILKESKNTDKLRKLDIHIPLDKCYDDEVYNKISGLKDIKEAIEVRMTRSQAELYENGLLKEAFGNKENLESKYRFYLWNNSALMTDLINDQVELDKVRVSL